MSAACGSGVVQSLAPKAKRGGVLNYTKYRHIYPILVSHGLQPHSHPFFALLPPLFSYIFIYSLSSHACPRSFCVSTAAAPRSRFGGCAILKYGKLWRSTDGRLRLTLEHVYFSHSLAVASCALATLLPRVDAARRAQRQARGQARGQAAGLGPHGHGEHQRRAWPSQDSRGGGRGGRRVPRRRQQ